MSRRKTEQGNKAREDILEMIVGYIYLHNIPPSIREILRETGIRSESTVVWHLNKLEEEGRIERTPHISRGISIPEKTRSDYLISYKCLYPFGCEFTSSRPGDCRYHGTELVLFVTRR